MDDLEYNKFGLKLLLPFEEIFRVSEADEIEWLDHPDRKITREICEFKCKRLRKTISRLKHKKKLDGIKKQKQKDKLSGKAVAGLTTLSHGIQSKEDTNENTLPTESKLKVSKILLDNARKRKDNLDKTRNVRELNNKKVRKALNRLR